MVQLNEIFDVWYGVNLEVVNSEVVDKDVPFVSRQSVNNGVVCHIKRIKGVVPNPAHTLSIAVSGSVLSTFYHDYEYYSGRDVYVAKPKIELTKAEMLYYCYVIEQNKYRYNYGRGANKTFRKILVPSYEEVPDYIKNNDVSWQNQFNKEPLSNKKLELKVGEWQWFDYSKLFKITGSSTTSKDEFENHCFGKYPYVTTQAVNNGVENFYDLYTEEGNVLTVDSAVLGFCSYQKEKFSASDHVETLIPLFPLNPHVAMFLITIINREQYRYSYGRKASQKKLKNSKIKLPAIKNAQGKYEPDWQFMEDYIKSLPYSKCLE